MSDARAGGDQTRVRPPFRPEVLEHRARGRTAGRVLPIGGTTTLAFRLLMTAVGASLALSFVISANQSTSGDALVVGDGSRAVLVLPVGSQPRLRTGLPVRLQLASGDRLEGVLVGPGQPATTRELRDVLGPDVANDGGNDVVAVAEAHLRGPAATAGTTGTGEVRLARRRLAAILFSGLARVLSPGRG